MGERPDWNDWILQKNAAAKQEELRKSNSVVLEKAYVNHKVPQGACDCGAHKTGSEMHSDWCNGLKAPSNRIPLKSGGHIEIGENDNYSVIHPEGNMHVWVDRGEKSSWPSYTVHRSDTDPNGSDPNEGFPDKLTPGQIAHHNEAIKAIKAHQAQVHGIDNMEDTSIT